MRISIFSAALLLSGVVSATPWDDLFKRGHGAGASCKTMDGMGKCMPKGKCNGVYYDGACGKDHGDIRCCVEVKCKVGGKSGQCQNIKRTKCKGGKFHVGSANTCPAGNDVQCCIEDKKKDPPKKNPKDPKKPAKKKPKKPNKKPKKPSNKKPKKKNPKKNVGQKVLDYAMKEKGTKYVWGGGSCKGPTKGGYDCSGLVGYAVCKATGRDLFKEGLRVTGNMYCASKKKLGKIKKVPFSKRRAGDAVFFGTSCSCSNKGAISHVGLMINSGDKMVHAPNSRSKVKEAKVSTMGRKACPQVLRFG
ncbi:hypothetical protein AJ79_05934 [Helicocarpus griseus UAMH5409]|uniref:NlpC/P60 domain-containing protein n=1 Tax=Helicocarpus griseus UAMH5409 TaxID=1447875 RepID=A0A2B7XIY0_9EURO|nr:hypothetical protein AJ79_05934 [Helicocarpus griseus UAMH5409]